MIDSYSHHLVNASHAIQIVALSGESSITPPESDVCGVEVCQIIEVESSGVNPDFWRQHLYYRFRYGSVADVPES